MPESAPLERLLLRQQSPKRARRFQIETCIVADPNGGKQVFKRALHAEGNAHLQRMAANQQRMQQLQTPVVACPCTLRDNRLEMAFIEGASIKQRLIQAIRRDDRAGIESLLELHRQLISVFDPVAAELHGPGDRREIFADAFVEGELEVGCGNIDQGFDHWIIQDKHWHLIDYEWVLGFAVPLKYVLYRAAQFFFLDVPPAVSPRFRLRDLCAFHDISPADRARYDQMEARFQHFVRTETETP
jgi:hypothetical protein